MAILSNTKCSKPGAIIIEGHVQGLSNTRALGEAGIPVVVIDKNNCIARYSKYCKKFFKCPPFESNAMVDFLIELAKQEALDNWLLVPSNDHAVLALSLNKVRLEDRFKVITPGLDIIKNIYDKSRLLAIAENVGIGIPDTFYAKNTKPENLNVAFPVLTKGRFGLDFYRATGRKAFLSNDLEELHKHLSIINKRFPVDKTFTQELIPNVGTNKTISFTAFCENGKIKVYWMGEKIREHPSRFGTATCARSIYDEEFFNYSVPLLKALDYTGVCEIEYLKDPRDGKYKLIEINARTWLWVELAKRCGVNYAKIMYDYVNGLNTTYPKQYDVDKYWINPFSEIFYSLLGVLTGKINISSYFFSMRGKKKVNALFAKNDWKPGVIYLLKLPFFLINR